MPNSKKYEIIKYNFYDIRKTFYERIDRNLSSQLFYGKNSYTGKINGY